MSIYGALKLGHSSPTELTFFCGLWRWIGLSGGRSRIESPKIRHSTQKNTSQYAEKYVTFL